jgi:hypothetical protein
MRSRRQKFGPWMIAWVSQLSWLSRLDRVALMFDKRSGDCILPRIEAGPMVPNIARHERGDLF